MAHSKTAKRISSLLRSAQGTVAIEAAILFPFLLIALMGILDITQYIEVRERMNKAANQVAWVLANGRTMEGAAEIVLVGRAVAAPHGVSIQARYCNNGNPEKIYNLPVTNSACGYGPQTGGTFAAVAACPPVSPRWKQTVSVTAGCNYSPMFNFLGLFGKGLPTSAHISMPLRYKLL